MQVAHDYLQSHNYTPNGGPWPVHGDYCSLYMSKVLVVIFLAGASL